MFCTSCGHRVREGDDFCTSCGARVVRSPTMAAPSELKLAVTFSVSAPRHYEKPPDPFEGASARKLQDLRVAKCPNCNQALSKVPAAKTKCPHCRQFMYVRTRPDDFARVVVTAQDAKRIEADYSIISGSREPDFRNITTASEVKAERERLTLTFKAKGYSEPSEDDVKWAILTARLLGTAKTRGMDDRNIRYLAADFLVRRWKLRDALAHYLLVCALDLRDSNIPYLSPTPLDQISRITRNLNLERDEVRKLFQRYYPGQAGLSESDCWMYLEKAIWPEPSTLREPTREAGSIARAASAHEIEQTVSLPNGEEVKIWRDVRAIASEIDTSETSED